MHSRIILIIGILITANSFATEVWDRPQPWDRRAEPTQVQADEPTQVEPQPTGRIAIQPSPRFGNSLPDLNPGIPMPEIVPQGGRNCTALKDIHGRIYRVNCY